MKQWVEEVQQRAMVFTLSGMRLMPCMSIGEANRLVQDFDKELSDIAQREAKQASANTAIVRRNAFLIAVGSVLSHRTHLSLRRAFDELALHSRLCTVHELQKRAAARRLIRGLGRPRSRLIHSVWRHWIKRASVAQDVLKAERQHANQKRLHLGAMIIATMVRERERSSVNVAMDRLFRNLVEMRRQVSYDNALRHQEAARQQEADESLEGSLAEVALRMCLSFEGPDRIVAQRLSCGAHLLRSALRDMELSRREWALRTWRADSQDS